MADLPPDRVTPGMPPFSFVKVEYFGPFTLKQGRCSVKRYGVLFTCLVLRAIHIEISHALDTSSFINTLRRFIARRGAVIEIRSDNATNFVGEKELKLLIKEWIKLLFAIFFCRSKSSGFLTPLLLLTMVECGSVVFVLFEKYKTLLLENKL